MKLSLFSFGLYEYIMLGSIPIKITNIFKCMTDYFFLDRFGLWKFKKKKEKV